MCCRMEMESQDINKVPSIAIMTLHRIGHPSHIHHMQDITMCPASPHRELCMTKMDLPLAHLRVVSKTICFVYNVYTFYMSYRGKTFKNILGIVTFYTPKMCCAALVYLVHIGLTPTPKFCKFKICHSEI